jgi:NADPH-dependent 2,4-dienoyl-CoA reductase/sulfur reductase-like enzyme
MDSFRLVVLGGGMVAGYAAKQMVELGLKPGELAILSADTSLPYERPPLSKGFLAGKETEASILINPPKFYQEHGIEVRLGSRVATVDTAGKRLKLESGGEVAFEKLVLATGSEARRLTVPGADLDNVLYLRTLANSKIIREEANSAKRAVVIGGGFIGMEVASVLAQHRIETTMVMPDERVWKQFFTPRMSKFFEEYFAARGVRFAQGVNVAALKGDRAVQAVELSGGRSIECDLVVAGIGAKPAIDFLSRSGIEMDNGVMVNEFLETSAPDILAAGDIANYPDLIFNKRRRVEHWDNAVSQGQHCARALMGHRAQFRHVPYFFSDVFDLSYEFWGDPTGAERIVERGDISTTSFSVWWLRSESVVAAFVMNRPEEERQTAPEWIDAESRVSMATLADAEMTLTEAVER